MKCGNSCKHFEDNGGSRSYCAISGLAVSEGQQCIEEKSGRKERFIPIDRMGASTNKNNKKK